MATWTGGYPPNSMEAKGRLGFISQRPIGGVWESSKCFFAFHGRGRVLVFCLGRGFSPRISPEQLLPKRGARLQGALSQLPGLSPEGAGAVDHLLLGPLDFGSEILVGSFG